MTDEEIVSLYGADGREMKFKKVASVPMDGRIYVVLAPVEAIPGMNDNQALVFEVKELEDGRAALNIVTDPATVYQVYETYGEITLRETEEKARKKDLPY